MLFILKNEIDYNKTLFYNSVLYIDMMNFYIWTVIVNNLVDFALECIWFYKIKAKWQGMNLGIILFVIVRMFLRGAKL